MLTGEDMKSRNITFEGICENSEAAKEFFADIILVAAAEKGFGLEEGSITAEAFPTVSGGCIIYLTRESADEIIAAFSGDYSVLRELCERLDTNCRSSLYTDSDVWILLLHNTRAKEFAGDYCRFMEISNVEAAAINEHCRKIFENNAVAEIIRSVKSLPPSYPAD